MRRLSFARLCFIVTLLCLCACGQKGPLKLPDPEPEQREDAHEQQN